LRCERANTSLEAWEHFVTHELVQMDQQQGSGDAVGWSTVERYVSGELELHVQYGFNSFLCGIREVFDLPTGILEQIAAGGDR
jgi:hypothetical protein